ncbi:MAG: hypothetical protein ACRC41_00655 [Sarcina sp.]
MVMTEYFYFILKLVLFAGGLLLILVAFLRKAKDKIEVLNKDKYVKIIEKTQISKNECIYVFKTGDEGTVILSSINGMQKIKDLSKEEILKLEYEKSEKEALMVEKYDAGIKGLKTGITKFLKKFKRAKE